MKILGERLDNIVWQDKPQGAKGPIWRYSENPIIGWNPTQNISRVFNSAPIAYQGRFVGIFRGDSRCVTPQLHLGVSPDGIRWEIDDQPIQWVDEQGRPAQPYYAYDPRLIRIDGIYYIIWCTDFHGPTIALGRTTDFRTFVRLENAFLPYNRNGVLFPRKIGGKFVLLSRPSDSGHTAFGDIFISESNDLVYWGKHRHVMSRGGSGWWQGTKVGAGSAPIETDIGWLLLYHGVTTTCNGFVYSIGGAILDIDDPSRVLYRCRNYLLTPETPYELSGFVPGVCFPCAALTDAATGRIAIYYGAADTCTALAFTTVDEVCSYIMEYCE